ncbi:PDR/VanB family oxidoreductase [Mycobacterium sp. NAZ190054]|uniref:PDR/VanB family oxidoreductase n=1 Tax=Mycobacterium sp. NAZ190054 TaxID=1747766 RepID=UPI00079A7579|nr:PDR/VanB family oxidoreductase [Mycobacterium sp. NAZ190054]KWX65695.1 hypothetical protein ASJ79_28250 [Mycobacterium sp. NAZ190054]
MTDTLERPADTDDAVISLVVVRLETVAHRVIRLELAAADGGPLPSWTPGAHIDLALGNGLVRQYSLCGDPSDTETWTLGILDEPSSRGGSRWICGALRQGHLVDARGPRNHFGLVEAGSYLMIAGGIGVTPILAMIRELDARGRDWSALYLGRCAESMAFVDDLARYGDRVTVWPSSSRGRADVAGALARVPAGAAVYCCGPAGLVDAVEAAALSRPDVDLHVERFRPGAVAPGSAADHAFEVVAAQSGVSVTVAPGTTIADALEGVGVLVPRSCGEGTCGSCETEVLEGVPDHRDSTLTERERLAGTQMMVCCSRAVGDRLVLDI